MFNNRFTTKCTHDMIRAMDYVANKNDISIAEYVRRCIAKDLERKCNKKPDIAPF